ncbi:tetratricopeptide repeat protein [Microbulbifer pacificus]|uniref:tetratricopeptide repeat protein n=1 Tax=Microbulbifer pacificus TaxID=407164 RepID=UPI00131A1503|nr:tetratricopeptide repeat protein [Microbulbifer pacificus]
MSKYKEKVSNERVRGSIQSLNDYFFSLYHQGKYIEALDISKVLYMRTRDPFVKLNQMKCLIRLGKLDRAITISKNLTSLKNNIDFNDVMSELYGLIGNLERVRHYGSISLRLKFESVSGEIQYPLPTNMPPVFNENDPSGNIISFSLFGGSPRYCEGALLNVAAVRSFLPSWKCRFYCDKTVPPQVIARLKRNGAEIEIIDSTKCSIPPVMWRFLVSDDNSVLRFMVRDCDSIIGRREASAVCEWVKSDKWFHVMRDEFSHTELILAGMWGGCHGVIPNMKLEIINFLKSGKYSLSHVDQHFLRHKVWPTMMQSLLSHDSKFDFFENSEFPVSRNDGESHVGANHAIVTMSGKTAVSNGNVIEWTLKDEEGEQVCWYECVVEKGNWSAVLPTTYAEKLSKGLWTVSIKAQD